MTPLERFKAVIHFEKPDYVPIFGFRGAGFAHGAFVETHRKLVQTGMPEWVGGQYELDRPPRDGESWERYWGTMTPLFLDFFPAEPPGGFESEVEAEGDYEVVRSETGAVTRRLRDNDGAYGMPEFIEYDVRDRRSWEFYRERMSPGPVWSSERIEEACRPFDARTKPLVIGLGGTWGSMRNLMGPERACTILYDNPDLARNIFDWFEWQWETYLFPLIERLGPEIIQTNEDICYNHGMLISPAHFEAFCGASYRRIGSLARDCRVDVVMLDTDGNAMEFIPIVAEMGVNGSYPFEVKAGNDLFELRDRLPHFVLMGWLEKEVMNEGKGHLIENEIMSKVPKLLPSGGYLPTVDHSIQPLVTFDNVCRFMTLLHDVTGNPEGEFPRIR